MSTTKETTVWCDADGCVEWLQVCERTNPSARREVRRLGWRYRHGKDYCPEHADLGHRTTLSQKAKS